MNHKEYRERLEEILSEYWEVYEEDDKEQAYKAITDLMVEVVGEKKKDEAICCSKCPYKKAGNYTHCSFCRETRSYNQAKEEILNTIKCK